MKSNFIEPDKSRRHFDGPVTISPMANLVWEKTLWRQGYDHVIGLDEAGRGPLAGRVVAAAVMLNPKLKTLNSKQTQNKKPRKVFRFNDLDLFRVSNLGFRISDVRDSKLLSEKQRERLYRIFTNNPFIEWGIGVVSEKLIDEINILEASKLAMKNALEDLYYKSDGRQIYGITDFLLIDGNFLLKGLDVSQKAIVRGDAKVFSISAAGIIAKVTRDRIMRELHDKYPQYGFHLHKGYGTALHISNLKNFGPSKIHRKTFYPVSSYTHLA